MSVKRCVREEHFQNSSCHLPVRFVCRLWLIQVIVGNEIPWRIYISSAYHALTLYDDHHSSANLPVRPHPPNATSQVALRREEGQPIRFHLQRAVNTVLHMHFSAIHMTRALTTIGSSSGLTLSTESLMKKFRRLLGGFSQLLVLFLATPVQSPMSALNCRPIHFHGQSNEPLMLSMILFPENQYTPRVHSQLERLGRQWERCLVLGSRQA